MNRAVVTEGDPSRGGWLKKALLWEWCRLVADGYPDFEIPAGQTGWYKEPCHVKVQILKGTDPLARRMAEAFDDVAEGVFYHSDQCADALARVDDGETYWGHFWFQTRADAERFRLMWLPYVVWTNYLTGDLTPGGGGVELGGGNTHARDQNPAPEAPPGPG